MHENIESRALIARTHGVREGNVLCLPSRSSRCQRKVWDSARPAGIHEFWKAWLPVLAPEVLVAAQRHSLLKITYVANLTETVVGPEPGPTCLPDQGKHFFFLSLRGALVCRLFVAAGGEKSQRWCGNKHRPAGAPPPVSLGKELIFEGVLGVARVNPKGKLHIAPLPPQGHLI